MTKWKVEKIKGNKFQISKEKYQPGEECHAAALIQCSQENACLIAASPELLEACKNIADIADGNEFFKASIPDEVLALLNTAIAKAEASE